MDTSALCRSCMKEVASWEKGNFDRTAVDMFCYCTHIKISDDDELPKQFCYDCFIKIESSYIFIKEAQKANATLKNIVSRDQTSIIVETDSLLKSFTPTAFTPKSVSLSLPDYEISSYSNFQEDQFFPEQEVKQDIAVREDNCELDKPNNVVMEDFQNEYDEFTSHGDTLPNTTQIEEVSKDVPDCENVFDNDNVHENTEAEKVDKNTKGHSCPICRKGFTFRAWLDRHLAKEHGDNPKYTCQECDKSFSKPHQLTKHTVTHTTERTFACNICDARFKKRKQLSAHARRHNDERPFGCNECGLRFKIKSILKSHMNLHNSEKLFLCSICGWSFKHAGNLTVHMRTHSGSKPYQCSECNFKCSIASSLTRHEARHRSAPAHRCSHCRKTFYDASGLARHTRTHTGALPYRCGACGRCFIDSWKRKTHLMRRHQVALHDIPRMNRNGDRL